VAVVIMRVLKYKLRIWEI